MDFQPLASSSAGCAYVLRDDGAPLLVDAGVRFADIQRALDFKAGELAGALISHAHGDHCKAVSELLRAGVPVYASAEAWKQMYAADCAHFRAKALIPHEPVQVGPWQVMPFDAVHDAPGTLGFLIGHGQARALYLTDSAYCRYRFEGLTHIFIECNFASEIMRANARSGEIHHERFKRTARNHMSLERLIDMLRANDLSRVEEIHLLHLSDANSDERAFKDAVQRATGRPVYIAPAAKEGIRL